MNQISQWLAVCDFDGTLVNDDITDLILENFADNSWKNIENDWINNKISAKQCMQQQIKLLSTRIDKNFLADFCKKIKLRSGVFEFFQQRKAQNLPTIIVSDGIDFVIEQILIANGINSPTNNIKIQVFSNNLQVQNNNNNNNIFNIFDLQFPFYEAKCLAGSGVCKCALTEQYKKTCQKSKFFLVGDGLSDVCLAKNADFVFCRKGYKLSQFCEQQKLKYAEFEDFSEISDFLQK